MITLHDIDGGYMVKEDGKVIGEMRKVGNNKWESISVPVKSRKAAIQVLQREAKK